MSTFKPTEEQENALALFATGESMVIEAGAGTGKTSTLRLLAASTSARIQYTAFSKSLCLDAKKPGVFPANVKVNTAHSLAYGAVGYKYRPRMDAARRMRSSEIARFLGVDPIWLSVGGERRVLQPGYLGSLALRTVTNFCQSADEEIASADVPYIKGIDLPSPDGRPTYVHNNEVAKAILPAARRAWADLQGIDGRMPFTYAHYLKIWALGNPRISTPIIMVDEAQDLSPVLLGILQAQTHAQIVWVGDDAQSIMGFTGAVSAMSNTSAKLRSQLTTSFRFGAHIADLANTILSKLGAPLRLAGSPFHSSTVGRVNQPDAVLTRTNAAAVVEVLTFQKAGIPVHLVGGSDEVVRFAEAAADLMNGVRVDHRDLACFENWNQVLTYVEADELGGELRPLVKLVEEFTVPVILDALANMTPEANARVVVSTAHKSKGREWDTVRLGSDFPDQDDLSIDELRLLYVAVTRAKVRVDVDAIPTLSPDDDPEPAAEPVPEVAAPTAAEPVNGVTFDCQGPGCGRAYRLGRCSGLADERFCGGVCRSKATRAVAV